MLAANAGVGVDVRVVVSANRAMLDLISKHAGTWVAKQVADNTAAGPFAPIIWANVEAAEALRDLEVDGEKVLAKRVLIDWSATSSRRTTRRSP